VPILIFDIRAIHISLHRFHESWNAMPSFLFKIPARLYAGFGALVLFGVGLASFGVWQLWAIQGQAGVTERQSVNNARAIEISSELHAFRRAVLRYTYAQDEAAFAEAEKRLGTVGNLAFYGMYLWIALATVDGVISVGELTIEGSSVAARTVTCCHSAIRALGPWLARCASRGSVPACDSAAWLLNSCSCCCTPG